MASAHISWVKNWCVQRKQGSVFRDILFFSTRDSDSIIIWFNIERRCEAAYIRLSAKNLLLAAYEVTEVP